MSERTAGTNLSAEDEELVVTLNAWRELSSLANAGWNLPRAATFALDSLTRKAAARIEAMSAALAARDEMRNAWAKEAAEALAQSEARAEAMEKALREIIIDAEYGSTRDSLFIEISDKARAALGEKGKL